MTKKTKGSKILLNVLLLLFFLSLYRVPQILFSHNWPETKGIVLSSEQFNYREVQGSQRTIATYGIRYRYEVDGRAYESDRINAGLLKSTSQLDPQLMIQQYGNAGDSIRVFYNPRFHSDALLAHGHHWTDFFQPAFILFFVLIVYLHRVQAPPNDDDNSAGPPQWG
jgi:hypothetical protein